MKTKQVPLFIGIMSGTSADGIDVAVVCMEAKPKLVHFQAFPMPEKLHEPILRLAEAGINEIEVMGSLHVQLGRAYAQAAIETIAAAGLQTTDIAAIGCHGQTIRHRPHAKHPFTLQIGCPATLAEATGITVGSDFRSRDIAAGGEGAPLVPLAHRQLFASDEVDTAVLNIGGIANITWLGKDGVTLGFDCGPGNMLMDGLMLAISDGRNGYDEHGELAASGRVCDSLLDQMMMHPFLGRRPPKSTGREEFGQAIVDQLLSCPDISDADRMATAAEFTARSIAEAIDFLPQMPECWLVCGGGSRNRHLMDRLADSLSPARVSATDDAGVPSQAVEAVSFALLAERTLRGQVNIFCSVTGALHDVIGGAITPGRNWADLIRTIPHWTL